MNGLLLLLLVATGVVIFLLWQWQSRPRPAPLPLQPPELEIRAEPDPPEGFGRKNWWISMKAPGAEAVGECLGLAEVQPANWRSGIHAAYAWPSSWVFVTPPIDGWVLAVGRGLPDPSDPASLPRWRALMSRLSERFGEVLYFATHRVSSYTAWAFYRDGAEVRLFAHADDPIHNEGTPLPEEAPIIAQLPDYAAAEAEPGYWDRDDIRIPEEEDVLRMAAAWSIDPSTFDDRELPPSVGLLGELA